MIQNSNGNTECVTSFMYGLQHENLQMVEFDPIEFKIAISSEYQATPI